MYCSMYLHCCGWCFSLAFVDRRCRFSFKAEAPFLPLTSMMIHHPSLSQHEFHGHYGWIRMDIYCSLSILNFPAKSNVLENGFGYIRKLWNILWIHFGHIWIFNFLHIFGYFWIRVRFPRDIWTSTSLRKTLIRLRTLPTWVLLEPKEIWETRSYPHLLPQKRGQLVFIGRERV